MKQMRAAVVAVMALLLLGVATPGRAQTGVAENRTLRITLKNLTSHQIFSPPLIAVGQHPDIFRLRHQARAGLVLIAEEGDNSKLAAAMERQQGVRRVIALSDPVMPGDSLTVKVEVRAGERLSLATMLVQTNDGFTGVSALSLDAIQYASLRLRTFDAGSERNNERRGFVPGPPFGGHRRSPTDGSVHYHPGIKGTGALDPSVYGWTDPSAVLSIDQVG